VWIQSNRVLKTGVDLIEIERVQRAVARHGARFLQRVYTATERHDCQQRMESLAARFAAKEAGHRSKDDGDHHRLPGAAEGGVIGSFPRGTMTSDRGPQPRSRGERRP